jgi:hypothetical protein
MKSFIFRVLIFIVALICFGQLTKSFLPYYWGNVWISNKYDTEHKNIINADYYFIGSSRTYRHIIPSIFDSLMALNGIQCHSFNLGSPAVFPPQSYYLLENAIIENDISQGSTIFFELSESRIIPNDQIGSARASYWSNSRDLLYILNYANHCASDTTKFDYIKSHTSAYLQNLFSIAQFRGLFDKTDILDLEENWINSHGYLSLDRELELTRNETIKKFLTDRNDELRRDTSILKQQLHKVMAIRSKNSRSCCDLEVDRMVELANRCKEKGIRLIFFLPAIYLTDELYSLYQCLPKDIKIDTNNPNGIPEIYQFKYRYDKGHLNENGAIKYTHHMALQYIYYSNYQTKF